jgi:dTDP-L-rhamnose 4-epimerase
VSTVLVTGGAGFIGSHTVRALLRAGHGVRILDNLAEPVHRADVPPDVPRDVEVVRGDVRDRDAWLKALAGVDAVVHLAAYQDYLPDFSKFFDVNAVGTALLYELIVAERLPVRRVVVASSQAVIGEGLHRCAACDSRFVPEARDEARLRRGQWEHPCPACGTDLTPEWSTEQVARPSNAYGMSKHSQEQITLTLGRRYAIPSVALRYSIVQGPGQSFFNAYSGACRIFALSLHFGRPARIYEDGAQLRDYVNIEDVVAANLLALTSDAAVGQAFNVGGGRGYTVRELWDTACAVFGKHIAPETGGYYRFGDTRHVLSDVSKLGALGWRPRYSPEKSLTDYRDWLRGHPRVEDVESAARRVMQSLGVVRAVTS